MRSLPWRPSLVGVLPPVVPRARLESSPTKPVDPYVNVRYVGPKGAATGGGTATAHAIGDYSITDLCREFDVTPRTIRHYESCGLLHPSRQGQRRIFSERDRVRLRLALRGRSLGFNLAEIAEMIDLYDVDPTEVTQLERTLAYGRRRIAELEHKRRELTAAIEELRAWERRLQPVLERAKGQLREGTRQRGRA